MSATFAATASTYEAALLAKAKNASGELKSMNETSSASSVLQSMVIWATSPFTLTKMGEKYSLRKHRPKSRQVIFKLPSVLVLVLLSLTGLLFQPVLAQSGNCSQPGLTRQQQATTYTYTFPLARMQMHSQLWSVRPAYQFPYRQRFNFRTSSKSWSNEWWQEGPIVTGLPSYGSVRSAPQSER